MGDRTRMGIEKEEGWGGGMDGVSKVLLLSICLRWLGVVPTHILLILDARIDFVDWWIGGRGGRMYVCTMDELS